MIDDRIMACLELQSDLFFHKIPASRIAYYVDTPLAFGREAAAGLAGEELFELYSRYGIVIDRKNTSGTKYGVSLRGQAVMGKRECRVELYEDSVRTLVEHSAFDSLPSPTYEEAVRMHLAHEFFHFLEYKTLGFVSERLDSVETMRFFALRRRAKLIRAGEIAAHAFAKELLRLPCLPNLYDYAYLVSTGKLTRKAFEAKCESAQAALTACT